MEEIREELGIIVGDLYIKYGGTEEILKLNSILDTLVLLEMKEINSVDCAIPIFSHSCSCVKFIPFLKFLILSPNITIHLMGLFYH